MDFIKANNKDKVIRRNNEKISKIKVLLETTKIDRSIKYRLFFMSCNLDHVLFEEMNLKAEDKVPKAFEFRKRYQKDKKGFFDFFNSKECKAYGTYDETWSFIKKDKNSLHRYNNLWIFLEELEKDNLN